MSDKLIGILDFTVPSKVISWDGTPDGWQYCVTKDYIDFDDWQKLLWLIGSAGESLVVNSLSITRQPPSIHRGAFLLGSKSIEVYNRYNEGIAKREEYDAQYERYRAAQPMPTTTN